VVKTKDVYTMNRVPNKPMPASENPITHRATIKFLLGFCDENSAQELAEKKARCHKRVIKDG